VPELLLERERDLEVLEAELRTTMHERRGRLVLVGGEAGIGKSALTEAFCARVGSHSGPLTGMRILRGACDALETPRAAGPILDIAAQTQGELAVVAEAGATPAQLIAPLLRELRHPTVMVLEDLHWADGSTLDTLRLLARRLPDVPALVLATYRDQLVRTHPLQMVLGELPPGSTRRISPQPLSAAAVARLGGLPPDRAQRIHTATAGNPFFVTELIAAGGNELPVGVRDAVLARVARLSPDARQLLEAVAISPQHTESWLLTQLAGEQLGALEECVRRERNAAPALRRGGVPPRAGP
jgi:predicted ATPase